MKKTARITAACLVVAFVVGLTTRLTHGRQLRELHLVLACEQGDAPEVHRLLESGVNPNAVVRIDESPLAWWFHELFVKEDLRVMRRPAILAASESNRLDIVDDLLEHGAKPDFDAASGRTALTCAVENWNLEIVRHLLAHNAKPILRYKDGAESLAEALADRRQNKG